MERADAAKAKLAEGTDGYFLLGDLLGIRRLRQRILIEILFVHGSAVVCCHFFKGGELRKIRNKIASPTLLSSSHTLRRRNIFQVVSGCTRVVMQIAMPHESIRLVCETGTRRTTPSLRCVVTELHVVRTCPRLPLHPHVITRPFPLEACTFMSGRQEAPFGKSDSST